jgi:iron(III) transport system permease protein
LFAGWILVFVPTLQELSASVLLLTSDTVTLAVATLNLQENGKFETVSALGIVMVALTSVCLSWRGGLLADHSVLTAPRERDSL